MRRGSRSSGFRLAAVLVAFSMLSLPFSAGQTSLDEVSFWVVPWAQLEPAPRQERVESAWSGFGWLSSLSGGGVDLGDYVFGSGDAVGLLPPFYDALAAAVALPGPDGSFDSVALRRAVQATATEFSASLVPERDVAAILSAGSPGPDGGSVQQDTSFRLRTGSFYHDHPEFFGERDDGPDCYLNNEQGDLMRGGEELRGPEGSGRPQMRHDSPANVTGAH